MKKTNSDLPQVHHREVEDLPRAVHRAEDGVPHHPRLEPGHQRREVRRAQPQRRPDQPAEQQRQQTGDEHDRDDDQVPALQVHPGKGQEEHRRQCDVDDQLLEVADRALGQEARPAQERAQDEE